MKYTFYSGFCLDAFTPISLKFGMMTNAANFFRFMYIWMTMAFTQEHRVIRKLEHVKLFCCKVAWSIPNFCDGWFVTEITAKKSCVIVWNMGCLNHLFFLFGTSVLEANKRDRICGNEFEYWLWLNSYFYTLIKNIAVVLLKPLTRYLQRVYLWSLVTVDILLLLFLLFLSLRMQALCWICSITSIASRILLCVCEGRGEGEGACVNVGNFILRKFYNFSKQHNMCLLVHIIIQVVPQHKWIA